MKDIILNRKKDSHKGTYGRIGVISGSTGMTGAAYLVAQSALRTGSGLVFSIIPKSLETILSIKLTEAILRPIEDRSKGHFVEESLNSILKEIKNLDVIALGPGFGIDYERVELVKEIIKSTNSTMVIDADGLNCLSKDINILKEKKEQIIITPHPGEMGRLLNLTIEEIESKRQYYTKSISEKYNIVAVLKGHKTIVSSPEGEVYVNTTGNPGMSTAGSGDVLTGMITSLLGQGLSPFNAAKLAVYLHGLAGDIVKEKIGEYGMIARDIIEAIPYSIKLYRNNHNI